MKFKNIFDNFLRLSAIAVMAMLPVFSSAEEFKVTLDKIGIYLSSAKPGDVITIADGLYKDVQLKWIATGSPAKSIIVKAEHPGKVIISGTSSLQLSGKYLTVSGLWFKDGIPARRSVVEFSANGTNAFGCRLTESVIENYNSYNRADQHVYVMLSGQKNRVDHCSLVGKKNIGVTLLVNLNGKDCLYNYHSIDHNYFGPRNVFGSNGAETIRIGTSQQSNESSRTTVSDNLFDRCSGEVEVVSVKSCDNVITRNTLWECQGLVVLRHGKRNEVSRNKFIGNGKPNTGGVRIVDEGHQVVNNTFWGLTGKRFFSALALMDCVPNSLPNRYVQVKNIEISNNHFFNCDHLQLGVGKDYERTLAPVGVRFNNNEIVNSRVTAPFEWVDSLTDITCKGNKLQISGEQSFEGFTRTQIYEMPVPTYNSVVKGRGASWWNSSLGQPSYTLLPSEKEIVQAADEKGLAQLVAEAKSPLTIKLIPGKTYVLSAPLTVHARLTIIGQENVLRYASAKGGSMIIIGAGGSLNVSDIDFDGSLVEGKTQASCAICSDFPLLTEYNLNVTNCKFRNFGESSCSAIRGMKTTFADSVVISNCIFRDNAGNGVDFSQERDDLGRYNVENLIIKNSRFFHFLGIPVNVYRGGNDESTTGPSVTVTNCSFEDCCNKQRGCVLRLIGTQALKVCYDIFSNSGRGGTSILLDDAQDDSIEIKNCDFRNSGKLKSNWFQLSL